MVQSPNPLMQNPLDRFGAVTFVGVAALLIFGTVIVTWLLHPAQQELERVQQQLHECRESDRKAIIEAWESQRSELQQHVWQLEQQLADREFGSTDRRDISRRLERARGKLREHTWRKPY